MLTFSKYLTRSKSHANIQNPALSSTYAFPPAPQRNMIPGYTGSQSSLSKVRSWIDNCLANHGCCGTGDEVELPARVIDVSASPVKLINSGNMTGRYTCLSHRWGPSTIATARATIDDLKREIPWDSLPSTFQHAILFTRQLGLDYIWIDSLCIIQDDNSDKDSEISQMDMIYTHAYLTVAATRCQNGNEGLYTTINQAPIRHLPDDWTLNFGHYHHTPVRTKRFTSMQFGSPAISNAFGRHQNSRGTAIVYARPFINHISHPEEYMKESVSFPLLQRGWVFQEWSLSPRVLHFTNQELVWECMEATKCECSNALPSWKQEFRRDLRYNGSLRSWHLMVSIYHELDLTYPLDRLPALSGLEKMF